MPNSLALAAELGEAIAGPFGRDAFEEMQTMYLGMVGRHPTFTSGFKRTRRRENVAIVAPPAVGKTFLTDLFIEECMGAVNYTDSMRPGLPRPVFGQMDGDSVSTETMRGGCTSDGRLIQPLILHMDLCYCSDLPTFLQSGEKRTKALNFLLLMGEDGKQDVFFQKFEELPSGAVENLAESIEGIRGLSFIHRPRRGFRLTAAVPFLLCFTHKELRGGRNSFEENAPGLLSRLSILEHTPTDQEVEDAWDRTVREVDCSELRDLNLQMWRTPIHDIPYPPEDTILNVRNWARAEGKSIAQEYEKPLHSVLNQRLKARIARLMAANAIARTFQTRDPDDYSPIPSIHYTLEDGRFAQRRLGVSFRFLADRFSQESAESQEEPERSRESSAVRRYVEFLRSLKEPYPLHVSRGGFKAYCAGKGLDARTVNNYLTKLRKAAIVQRQHGADEITNDAQWLSEVGFVEPIQDEHEHEHDESQHGEEVWP